MRRVPYCPKCRTQVDVEKVMYMGFPMYLCDDPECDYCVFGFWSWILEYVPFNGMFFFYQGSYLSGLWHWLFKNVEDFEP